MTKRGRKKRCRMLWQVVQERASGELPNVRVFTTRRLAGREFAALVRHRGLVATQQGVGPLSEAVAEGGGFRLSLRPVPVDLALARFLTAGPQEVSE